MVIHKAIGEKRNSDFVPMSLYKPEIDFSIRIIEKHFLPTVPALDDMVRTPRDDETGELRHAVNGFS
jgi:hypothetical protein